MTMPSIGPDSLFLKFIDPKNFYFGYTIDTLGYLLVTPQHLSCELVHSIDSDLKQIISKYFNIEDCDIINKVTTRKITQELYGNMTGIFYYFFTLYANRLYNSNTFVPQNYEIYKYKLGIDIAEIFTCNIIAKNHNLYQDMYLYFISNKNVSTYKYVHSYLIKEASEFIDLRNYLGAPIKNLYHDLFKHDPPTAVAITVQTIFSWVAVTKEIKIRKVE